VDANLAKFVLDHRDALAVLLGQDAVQQRGLAGAEETGEHRDRNAGRAHARNTRYTPPSSSAQPRMRAGVIDSCGKPSQPYWSTISAATSCPSTVTAISTVAPSRGPAIVTVAT